MLTANAIKDVVCEGGTSVGRGYSGQREDFDVGWLELADHVA